VRPRLRSSEACASVHDQQRLRFLRLSAALSFPFPTPPHQCAALAAQARHASDLEWHLYEFRYSAEACATICDASHPHTCVPTPGRHTVWFWYRLLLCALSGSSPERLQQLFHLGRGLNLLGNSCTAVLTVGGLVIPHACPCLCIWQPIFSGGSQSPNFATCSS
jgi:hypothetical protein